VFDGRRVASADPAAAVAVRARPRWLVVGLGLIAAGVVLAWLQPTQAWSSLMQVCGLVCLVIASVPPAPSKSDGAINKRLALLVGCVAALGPATVMLVGNWSAGQLWLPPWTYGVLPTLAFLSFMPLLVLAGTALPYALASRWWGRRSDAAGALWIGGGAIAGLVLLFGASQRMMELRVAGFARLGKAATPIVNALHRFERERGVAASSLQELVPGYLPELPGWADRINYYRPGQSARELYDNPWVLIVHAGFGLGFDSFVYFPKQNYPAYFYGGGPERVGDWVYVHE